MKIIASASDGIYLAEISHQELRILDKNTTPAIGNEYPIKKAAQILTDLKALRHSRLAQVKYQIDILDKAYKEALESMQDLMILEEIKNDNEDV